MFKRHFVLALVFGMAATAPPVMAQALNCAGRDMVTERLASGYDEKQTGLGLQSENRLVEIWSSEKTGSWTILVTLPDGTSCVLASGANWIGAPPLAMPAVKGQPS